MEDGVAVAAALVMLSGFAIFGAGWFSCVREIYGHGARGIGIASFVFPFIPLAYAFLHWSDLKRQGLFMVVGGALLGIGIGMMPARG